MKYYTYSDMQEAKENVSKAQPIESSLFFFCQRPQDILAVIFMAIMHPLILNINTLAAMQPENQPRPAANKTPCAVQCLPENTETSQTQKETPLDLILVAHQNSLKPSALPSLQDLNLDELKDKFSTYPLIDQLAIIKEKLPNYLVVKKEQEWQKNPPCSPCAFFSMSRSSSDPIKSHIDCHNKFLVITNGRYAHIIEQTTGEQAFAIREHDSPVIDSFFNAKGTKLVLYWEQQIDLYDTITKSALFQLNYTTDYIRSCAYSPQETYLVITNQKEISLLNLVTTDIQYRFEFENKHSPEYTITPNEQFMSINLPLGSGKKIYDLQNNSEFICDPKCKDSLLSSNLKYSAAILPNSVDIWNAQKKEKLFSINNPEKDCCKIYFDRDSKLITLHTKNHLEIWNIPTRVKLFAYDNSEFTMHNKHDLIIIKPWGNNKSVKLWDCLMQKDITSIIAPLNNGCEIILSDDGDTLLCITKNDLVVWDRHSLMQRISILNNFYAILKAQFSPKKNLLLLEALNDAESKIVKIIKIATGEEIFEISLEKNLETGYHISHNENRMISTKFNNKENKNRITIWDLNTKRKLDSFNEPDDCAWKTMFSPCNNYLAGKTSHSVFVYNLLKDKILLDYVGKKSQKRSFSFNYKAPLLSVTLNHQNKIWDLSSGKKILLAGIQKDTDIILPRNTTSTLLSYDEKTIQAWDLKPQLSWEQYAFIIALHKHLTNKQNGITLPDYLMQLFNSLPSKYKKPLHKYIHA